MNELFVYIAGKYQGESLAATEANVLAAKSLAIQCAQFGIKHFCPHTHSQGMEYAAPRKDREWWLELDFEIIKKICNAMIMVDNWQNSVGARRERDLAIKLGYPIFYKFCDLLAYAQKGKDEL